ncbi:hypothetical protein [Dyadobacter sp. CY343]|uniref:hypothetical protein n=1 Tax=Dyadobacter sp. CY343 TaxID=2907299 RepID=UPI001F380810|nr:hypothetical protein [Dyadobacter sp. CY343]MCE7061937.1 hypothetical protein [Dyadobacter sp. CY343]
MKNKVIKGSVTSLVSDAYNKFLVSILAERLCESGSVLKDLLTSQFNITPDNARKVISRASNSKLIKSSDPFTFGKGQFIYLLADKDLDVEKVKSICKDNRPPIFRLLKALDENNGIISYYEALKITASPLEPSTTKVSNLDDITNLLRKLDIIYIRTVDEVKYLLYLKEGNQHTDDHESALITDHRSKMYIDSSMLPDILRWLAKCNMITTTQSPYRNRNSPSIGAKLNNLVWDATSFTRATGINPIVGSKADSKEKQTLVVLDVVLSSEYLEAYLDGFYNRIQIVLNSTKQGTRKVMPVIIYSECSEAVQGRIRKLGFISYDIGSIFGTKIYQVLKTLKKVKNVQLMENVDKTVENLLSIIKDSGQEDSLRTLKGLLFEALLFPLLKTLYPNSIIEPNKKLTVDGKTREFDYIIKASNPVEIVLIELKGYSASAAIPVGDHETKDTLGYFFRGSVPLAQKYFKKNSLFDYNIRAAFLTSGTFWKDGREFLKHIGSGKLQSSVLGVSYDREDLITLLKKYEFKRAARIIDDFFC